MGSAYPQFAYLVRLISDRSYPCVVSRRQDPTQTLTVVAVGGDDSLAGTVLQVAESVSPTPTLDVTIQLSTMPEAIKLAPKHHFSALPFVNFGYLDISGYSHPALEWEQRSPALRVGTHPDIGDVEVVEAFDDQWRLTERTVISRRHRREARYQYEPGIDVPQRIEVSVDGSPASVCERESHVVPLPSDDWIQLAPWRSPAERHTRMSALG